jgi:hypothetical protein
MDDVVGCGSQISQSAGRDDMAIKRRIGSYGWRGPGRASCSGTIADCGCRTALVLGSNRSADQIIPLLRRAAALGLQPDAWEGKVLPG